MRSKNRQTRRPVFPGLESIDNFEEPQSPKESHMLSSGPSSLISIQEAGLHAYQRA
jgi:hypothetical protein